MEFKLEMICNVVELDISEYNHSDKPRDDKDTWLIMLYIYTINKERYSSIAKAPS